MPYEDLAQLIVLFGVILFFGMSHSILSTCNIQSFAFVETAGLKNRASVREIYINNKNNNNSCHDFCLLLCADVG